MNESQHPKGLMMIKATMENLMIAVIAATLLIVGFLGKEEYSPISFITPGLLGIVSFISGWIMKYLFSYHF